jgi:hypothetical protein
VWFERVFWYFCEFDDDFSGILGKVLRVFRASRDAELSQISYRTVLVHSIQPFGLEPIERHKTRTDLKLLDTEQPEPSGVKRRPTSLN